MGLFGNKKRALVLGGGSARGLSNIGVLKVFEREFGRGNLPFDMIVGTSIGSLIGAAYCSGLSLEELEKDALRFNWPSIVDLGIHPTGLIKGDKLESIIRKMVGDKGFENMDIPFALTTTDIETGEERIHTSGTLVKLVRASCSWPGIFAAVNVEGRLLVDGGVRNSVPTKAAHGLGASFTVAVDPGFAVKSWKIDNVLKAFVQGIQIMGAELNAYQAKRADFVINPVLENIDQFDYNEAAYIIKQGELAAEKRLGAMRKKMLFLRWKY